MIMAKLCNFVYRPTSKQLQQLCHALWSWQLCADCTADQGCMDNSCPSRRLARLEPFFQHYRRLSVCENKCADDDMQPIVDSHEDFVQVIHTLRSNAETSRSCLRQQLRKLFSGNSEQHLDEIINLCVRIIMMLNCTATSMSPRLLEQGLNQIAWQDSTTFAEFINQALPVTDHPLLNDQENGVPDGILQQMSARKLKKYAKISFKPTLDIRNHLKFDNGTNTVEIFYHFALLKEHLRITKGRGHNLSTSQCLQLGALPRQLILEVIDSVQKILFPLTDQKNFSLLRAFIIKNSLDPDCLRFDAATIREEGEMNIKYYHFGARLAHLYEILQDPRPQGTLEKWMERRSGARYVIFATILGIFLALFIGMLTLAVSIYQAYISYQAWKHPIHQ